MVIERVELAWQLPGLAQRYKAALQRQRQRRAPDEAPRLKACIQASRLSAAGLCTSIAQGGKGLMRCLL